MTEFYEAAQGPHTPFQQALLALVRVKRAINLLVLEKSIHAGVESYDERTDRALYPNRTPLRIEDLNPLYQNARGDIARLQALTDHTIPLMQALSLLLEQIRDGSNRQLMLGMEKAHLVLRKAIQDLPSWETKKS